MWVGTGSSRRPPHSHKPPSLWGSQEITAGHCGRDGSLFFFLRCADGGEGGGALSSVEELDGVHESVP